MEKRGDDKHKPFITQKKRTAGKKEKRTKGGKLLQRRRTAVSPTSILKEEKRF